MFSWEGWYIRQGKNIIWVGDGGGRGGFPQRKREQQAAVTGASQYNMGWMTVYVVLLMHENVKTHKIICCIDDVNLKLPINGQNTCS